MEIVPTTAHKKTEIGLDVLLTRKAELKQEIQDQKIQISVRTKHLFSPLPLANNLFRTFTNGLNVVDGVMMGFKIAKSIRSIFRKFR